MEIRIRAGTRKDRDVLWKATMETVWDDIPAEERRGMDRAAFEDHFRPRAAQVIESAENAVFVAEGADGSVVGYTIVGGASSMLAPTPFGFVYDLWVAADARRQGIARRLLARAEQWCRGEGLPRLKLEVATGNAAARRLYASSGFSEERVYMGKTL